MKIFFDEKEGNFSKEILLAEKERKKLIEFFVSGRQKPHGPFSKSVQAFLATVPHHTKLMADSSF